MNNHASSSQFAGTTTNGDCSPTLGSIDRPTRGVIVPMITPLSARDALDIEGLERLVEHVLDGGVQGIFLLGTSGESAALCGRVRRDLVSRVCRQVGQRVPVLVGISDTALVESLRLAEEVAIGGAAAVVVTTPYYLPLEPSELVSYIRAVSLESPLPVFLYNMPELSGMWFSTAVLKEVLDLENVAGIKDSSGDESYFEEAKRIVSERRPDWSLLIGSEVLLASAVQGGAHGGVTGGANVHPKLFASIYAAALARDQALLESLQQQVIELSRIYRFGGYAVGTIRGIKCALRQMSIVSDQMASPFFAASEHEQTAIAESLTRLGLLNGETAIGFQPVRIDEAEKSPRMYGSPAPAGSVASAEER